MKSLFWVSVNLIGFFILTFMYIDTWQPKPACKTSEKKYFGYKIFKFLQITLALFLIFDTGMYLTDGISSHARILHYIFSMLFYLITPLPGFIFLIYCDFITFNDENGLKKRLRFYSIPMIINSLAVFLTPLTGMLFSIDENNIYSRGDFIWITMIAGIGYLAIYPILYIKTRKKQALTCKGSDIYLFLFPLPPLISAIIQLLYHGPLLLGISFVISAYFLYTNNIQSAEDKRKLSVRFNNIRTAHFGVISFIMISVMLWTIENTIDELSREFDEVNQVKLLLPFGIIIILFIIYVYSTKRITQRMIFNPLKLLVDSLFSVRESSMDYKPNQHKIYGIERDDEIGLLANTIQDLFVKGHFDGLTGIYNRRYMETTMRQIMTMLSRTNAMLSVMIVDIDFFKQYNDTYGHIKGDDCLKLIAQTLDKLIIRKGDFIARYGGEEFAVILPGTEEEGARLMAAKMLYAIQELKIPNINTKTGIVTISIGLTTGRQNYMQNWDEYIKRADDALYKTKNNGRNWYTFLPLTEANYSG